jgi:hypothetical protein
VKEAIEMEQEACNCGNALPKLENMEPGAEHVCANCRRMWEAADDEQNGSLQWKLLSARSGG